MPEDIHINLSKKDSNTVKRAISELFSTKGFEPLQKEIFSKLSFFEFLRREIRVNGKAVGFLKTELGVEAQRKISSIFYKSLRKKQFCVYSDVNIAIKNVYEELMSANLAPESAEELAQLVSQKLTLEIKEHTFVVAIRGVDFENCSELDVGHIKLVASIDETLRSRFPDFERDLPKERSHLLMSRPCLIGSRHGTLEAATHWFETQTFLYAALLAIFAGDIYERGAFGFHIEPLLHRSPAGSIYVNWTTDSSSITRTHSFVNGNSFLISKDILDFMNAPGPFSHALALLEKENPSDIEDNVCRAVYWYGDAHRDPISVMQFIKYWSCIECLVGSASNALTETLALGLVTVLTFGSYPRMEKDDWKTNISEVKRLYSLRSRAVHQASHSHITESDSIIMSKWAAGLILNVISIAASGISREIMWEKLKTVAQQHNEFLASAKN